MNEANRISSVEEVIHVEGNALTLKIGGYVLSLKIEGPEIRPSGRLRLEAGRTLFDLVFDAARTFVSSRGNEFTAADLYYIAKENNPDLDIRKNSWNSHVMSSSPNHPSYRHYTSHRNYFRYHGDGKYSLEPSLITRS
jgi:hypothetical protein